MDSEATDLTQAVRLKDEGNKHFEKKEFSQAIDKYTAALKKGGENAILYSNRAACLLSQRKFLDAMDDAEKATKLDPKYSKGWGRLAAAYMGLMRPKSAIPAYEAAIETLSNSNLTPVQEKMKKQYEDGLSQATELLRPRDADVMRVPKDKVKDTPLERADAILKGFGLFAVPTSAWVIGKAYEDWKEGLKKLEELKEIKLSDGQNAMYGSSDAILCFTNAILRDLRVFHAVEGWFEKIEKQCHFEIECCYGWRDLGPKAVLQEAQARVANNGWEGKPDEKGLPKGGARKAISTQVRVWILRAFLLFGISGHHEASEALYRDTLEFLESGRKIWANVPKDDRGTVFEDTFMRGIRALHLLAFRNATMSDTKGRYTLKSLFELAKNVYDDAKAANENKPGPLSGIDLGFIASFYVYPVGNALSTMAFCYRKMGDNESDEAKKRDFMLKAGKLYHESSRYYFEDDEQYSYFLTMSLGAYWHSGIAGLDVSLPILKELEAASPKMKKIWEHSALNEGNGRDGPIKHCLDIYEMFKQGIASGELKEDSPCVPDSETIRQL